MSIWICVALRGSAADSPDLCGAPAPLRRLIHSSSRHLHRVTPRTDRALCPPSLSKIFSLDLTTRTPASAVANAIPCFKHTMASFSNQQFSFRAVAQFPDWWHRKPNLHWICTQSQRQMIKWFLCPIWQLGQVRKGVDVFSKSPKFSPHFSSSLLCLLFV